ncbi:molybdopterin molybdenumtransferase MoeA [Sphingobacteriales bacterium UPWRP_1]|nr:hypothetical protein B6N25_17135 [Sphingobacteriales bacterium TSM_CSS]PSJ73256.1 molybdopterin molybdenumtransferase MoeA [Sphingobacteriales bacterium UPWRP_1]
MISVAEAIQIVLTHSGKLQPVNMALPDVPDLILGENVVSDADIPPFDQSAMDGYAIRFADLEIFDQLQINGEAPAGNPTLPPLSAGFAARIFTGAPVPPNADTVVMQEKVTVNGSFLFVADPLLKQGANIRLKGSQCKQGAMVLPAGVPLTAGAVGFLAMIGRQQVLVQPPPRIAILVTGKELATPGQPLLPGQVYDCNSYSLQAALKNMHLPAPTLHKLPDDLAQITVCLTQTLPLCDIVLLTGGVSVGDYDLVPQALKQCGVEIMFHKVKQKPGKPLLLGKKNGCLVFGLPGNPASVFTCFYRYVVPAIQQMMGLPVYPNGHSRQLATEWQKKPGLTVLLKGKINAAGKAEPLSNQESYLMDSFAQADCLIELPEEQTRFEAGQMVKVHFLHYPFTH